MHKLLSRGAEAVLYLKKGILVKDRIRKGYRIKQIDTLLRKKRTKDEEKLLRRARAEGVMVPQVFGKKDFSISMEYLDGAVLKDILPSMRNSEISKTFIKLAGMINSLHKADIIHGDLTTSNILLRGDDLYLIDFGLGFISKRVEDKAVDLYLLKKALESKHTEISKKAFSLVLSIYEDKEVLKRLGALGFRGRYKRKGQDRKK